jgi:hypothetical protein
LILTFIAERYYLVIPAKAGIQASCASPALDPRFREGDEPTIVAAPSFYAADLV